MMFVWGKRMVYGDDKETIGIIGYILGLYGDNGNYRDYIGALTVCP